MKIHVVSFQVPYPANYGGAIDVYYKLKALQASGIGILLHTYLYGDATPQERLHECCEEVHYYRRETGFRHQLHLEPYISASRRSDQLLRDLCADQHPILFEGLHCCHFLDHPLLKGRKKWVRMHNIEQDYYRLLAQQKGWGWRSLYYTIEAWKLKRFERILCHADGILAISEADTRLLHQRYPHKHVELLPCFHDNTLVSPQGGTAPYLLYQGNLAVEENIRVADFIQDQLAARMPEARFVLAGRNPAFASRQSNVELRPNPSDEELEALLANARVNLLFTFQPTGIKLKLMNALSKSRGFVVANAEMLHGNDLARLCIRTDIGSLGNLDKGLIPQLYALLKESPTLQLLCERQAILRKMEEGRVSRLSLLF